MGPGSAKSQLFWKGGDSLILDVSDRTSLARHNAVLEQANGIRSACTVQFNPVDAAEGSPPDNAGGERLMGAKRVLKGEPGSQEQSGNSSYLPRANTLFPEPLSSTGPLE